MKKNEIILAFISALISIIFTAIYDYIKEKPFFSTLSYIINWIWNTVFEFELNIWKIILIIIGFTIIKKIIKFLSKNDTSTNDWLNYTEDSIEGLKWRWKWRKNPLTHKWNVDDIRIVCSNCGTSMNMDYNITYGDNFAECPRCDKKISRFKDIGKIEAIIIDNIDRGLYKDRMINSSM